jgi:predicted transcriptional regulator
MPALAACRIDPAILDRVKALASVEQRTVSAVLRRLIESGLTAATEKRAAA